MFATYSGRCPSPPPKSKNHGFVLTPAIASSFLLQCFRAYSIPFFALLVTFLVGATLIFVITRSNTPTHLLEYPWVPPRALGVDHPWWNATERAKALVKGMTLEEKVTVVTGTGWQKGPCVGNIAPVSRIGFKGLCLQDGPAGVRYTENVTAFPASINIAATFDKALMLEHGESLGREFRAGGAHVALAPMMNFYRTPAGGRNWEGQGADPYLSSISSSLQVRGIQSQGVIATAKHLIANEQEHFRMFSSSNVDDRTLMELYMAPFEACVREGVGAVMCSYNKLNHVYTCENSALVNHILKGPEVDFQGFVMTDWWAAHSEVPTAMVTDMMMPGTRTFISTDSYFGAALIRNVRSGRVPELRVDDMVTRILAAHFKMNQDVGFPLTVIDSWRHRPDPRDPDGENRETWPPMLKRHAEFVRKVGAASSVLLKNEGGVLPIRGVKKIAVLGEDAGAPETLNRFPDRAGDEGTLAQGWGSGTTEFSYIVSPLKGITARAKKAGIEVVSNLSNMDRVGATKLAAESDLAIVFVNADSGEGYLTVELNNGDRNDLKLWHYGDKLIEAVAAANKPTIVVIHAVGPVEMPWINHPSIAAVIFALLPGQESGNAIADVLFGDVNPSGRLPFTIHHTRKDYPADVIYASWYPIPQIDYTEGLFIDYMHADMASIKPLFPFGHGLSYSFEFKYSDLSLNSTSLSADDITAAWRHDRRNRSGPAKHTLVNSVVGISVTITNSDVKVGGHEVVQLYVSFPDEAKEPPRLLKGFERVWVGANESVTVQFSIGFLELRTWGVVGPREWGVVKGKYKVAVGASSRDLRGEGQFIVV
ncbi:hypothetical protein HDU67_003928 [Dinochytrium kinnereticum]|nr:hypothetical protein HDU67_003928 [Dinochytrium kinnereticum]